MGLREINATRTRELIATGALELFTARGFEATTMEDVATSVGIGTSTLYRYFPTKETLATALLGDPGLMAEALSARPAEEPLEVALGNAVIAFVSYTNEDPERSRQFGELIEANPRLQGRLLEWLGQANDALVGALAERAGLPATDLHMASMAWMAIFVLQRIDPASTGGSRAPTDLAADVMEALAAKPVLTPRLASGARAHPTRS